MISILSRGAAALEANARRFDEAAADTERAVRPPVEDRVSISLEKATVDRIHAEHGFRAALAVVRTAADMAHELTRER